MWRKSQANCIVGMGEKKKAKNDGLIDDDDRVDHKKSFHFPLCIVKLYYYYIRGERDRKREIDIHTNIQYNVCVCVCASIIYLHP